MSADLAEDAPGEPKRPPSRTPADTNGDADEVVEGPSLSIEGNVDEGEPRLRKERAHDKTRAGLAWALFFTFAGTVLAVILVVALGSHARGQDATELLKTLLPAETALLGSAVGFYFGTRNQH